jgi:hypothetical protein
MPFSDQKPRLCFGPAAKWLIKQAIAIAVASALVAPAQAQSQNEYQVKAAFLYNFAKFVEWPASAFQGSTQPMALCILGRDPFGHWLKEIIDGRSVEGRAVVLRHISNASEAGSCHVLFAGASESKRTWSALESMKTPGLLTVGDCTDAREGGAIITFTLEGDRVRFEVNNGAAERGKLRISSRLLSLARNMKEQHKQA